MSRGDLDPTNLPVQIMHAAQLQNLLKTYTLSVSDLVDLCGVAIDQLPEMLNTAESCIYITPSVSRQQASVQVEIR